MKKFELSVGSINDFFVASDKSKQQTNCVLQIIFNCEQPLQQRSAQSAYVCTLSDSKHSYNSFLVPKTEPLQLYDFIRVLDFSKISRPSKNCLFLINRYERLTGQSYLIGNPKPIEEKQPNGGLPSNIKTEHENNYLLDKPQQKLYTTLSTLNTFSRDIKVLIRIINVSQLRTYVNEKGEGHLLNVIVIDQEGTEMLVTCFNKLAHKYSEKLKEGHVYELTGGYVKVNQKRFKTTNSDYQLILNENSTIKEVSDDGTITKLKVNIRKLGELKRIDLHTPIDTLGYVVDPGERLLVTTKNGDAYMRKVYIADDTEYRVELALWKNVTEIELEQGDIILVRNCVVSEFNGRNLSGAESTKIIKNPRCMKEAVLLLKWAQSFNGTYKSYSSSREKGEYEAIDKSNVFNFEQVFKEAEAKIQEKKEEVSGYFTIKVWVSFLNHSDRNYYAGCPSTRCKKKLTDDNGVLFCTSCNLTVTDPAYYFTIAVRAKDNCSECWIDMYGGTAEHFFGLKAEEYREIFQSKNYSELDKIQNSVDYRQYYMLIRVKTTLFNNISKRRITAYRTEPVDRAEDYDQVLRKLTFKNE